jgi:rubrerythrin
MAKSLDFSGLDLQDALDLAILVEDEAQERYLELAEQMDEHRTHAAAEFFRFMAGNEAKHGEELGRRRRDLFGDLPRRVDRSLLWEVEAPTYDTVRAFMSLRQALQVALDSEVKAHEFFVEALRHVSTPDVRTLLEELREEEVLHQTLVRNELARVAPEPEADAESFADEPVAQ